MSDDRFGWLAIGRLNGVIPLSGRRRQSAAIRVVAVLAAVAYAATGAAGVAASAGAEAGTRETADEAGAAPGRTHESAWPAGDAINTYELVDTWESVPWELKPGHIFDPEDVTSGPDGRLSVLDRRTEGSYLHIFSDGTTPSSVVSLSGDVTQARLDAASDGTVFTVGRARSAAGVPQGRTRYIVERYDSDGILLSQFSADVPSGAPITDIAVAPSGLIYLARGDPMRDEDPVPTAIDVYDSSGSPIDVIDSTDYYTTDYDDDQHYHMQFTRIDVAPNGNVIALLQFLRGGT